MTREELIAIVIRDVNPTTDYNRSIDIEIAKSRDGTQGYGLGERGTYSETYYWGIANFKTGRTVRKGIISRENIDSEYKATKF